MTPSPPTPAAATIDLSSVEKELPSSPKRVEAPQHSGLIFGWTGGIISKVAEKTRTSVETMITTLDPQMKDFIYSGGDVEIVVASDKEEAKIFPVRDAFQKVFGKATVRGVKPQSAPRTVAEQPVGFAAGKRGALERVAGVKDAEVVVAIEGFLLEVGEESWVEQSCLLLSDAPRKIQLTCYSQPTHVDARFVEMAKEATPEDDPKRYSGLKVTVASLMAREWEGVNGPNWQEAVCGVSRPRTLELAAEALAGMYQRQLAMKNAQ